jgi:UDP-N-acetylmuramate dehydrogenase
MDRLPSVRGCLQEHVAMSKFTWFRVGGEAEVLFLPADQQDLSDFLAQLSAEILVTVIGIGSNLLVRDGGIDGVVIRLGGGFNSVDVIDGNRVRAGAAAPDIFVAKRALQSSLAGLEFMRGIPGSVGGALRMNAGAYGREIKDVLIESTVIDRQGLLHTLSVDEMGLSYRHSQVPDDYILVEAVFQARPGAADKIDALMNEVTSARESSQPVRSRTGGSTFKNPDPEISLGKSAWQLIDQAGCRGLIIGDAQVSEQHCNFLINRGDATAADLEKLGETVRSEVEKDTGIKLEWEIRRIGRPLNSEAGRYG